MRNWGSIHLKKCYNICTRKIIRRKSCLIEHHEKHCKNRQKTPNQLNTSLEKQRNIKRLAPKKAY